MGFVLESKFCEPFHKKYTHFVVPSLLSSPSPIFELHAMYTHKNVDIYRLLCHSDDLNSVDVGELCGFRLEMLPLVSACIVLQTRNVAICISMYRSS